MNMMQAIKISEFGNPEVLIWTTCPVPEPEDNEVLINVAYAGVNRPDIAQRKGRYPAPAGAPKDIPGLEVSGIIERAGKNVNRFKKGDQVCALLGGGGYAEFVCAQEGQCLPLPSTLNLKDAASLPEAIFTVWHNLFRLGALKAGETTLVHGGTSGIGVMAIQMGIAAGAKIITTVGSELKQKACLNLGAIHAINYNTTDFAEVIPTLTRSEGVQVILDMVGGSYTQKNLDCLATDGRLVLINYMSGDETTIRLSSILRKRLTITGSTLRNRESAFKTTLTGEVLKNVWPWLESSKVVPVIDSVFPMHSASAAHLKMESGTHIGKILLENKKAVG